MIDLVKLGNMHVVAKPGSTLKQILAELVPLTAKVSSWVQVPTSGSVVCYYDTVSGKPTQYEVKYQQGNIGNLVHELIHVAVNEAYEHDFVNYPNRTAAPAGRTFDSQGRCINEFERQTQLMDHGKNASNSDRLRELSNWANAATELSAQQRADIVSKFSYGLQWPHKEYDTVITQVLVWLHEWGYPISNASMKPVVNALFEEVEKAVADAYQLRQAG